MLKFLIIIIIILSVIYLVNKRESFPNNKIYFNKVNPEEKYLSTMKQTSEENIIKKFNNNFFSFRDKTFMSNSFFPNPVQKVQSIDTDNNIEISKIYDSLFMEKID